MVWHRQVKVQYLLVEFLPLGKLQAYADEEPLQAHHYNSEHSCLFQVYYFQSLFLILHEEHLAACPFDLGKLVHVADSLHLSAAIYKTQR